MDRARHQGKHAPRGRLDRDLLAELVEQDLSVRQIAAAVDRSPTTVRHWLARHGLETTAVARARNGGRPRTRTVAECTRHGLGEHITGGDGVVRCVRCRADDVTEWRRRTKRRLVAEAGGACLTCGFDRHPAALQFHHLDPATKAFGLGERGLTRSFERLRAEVAKCVLLCANCHAMVEAGALVIPDDPRPRYDAGSPGRG